MRKRISLMSTCMIMFVMVCAVLLGACGCQAENKTISLTITPATWNNEGYTITNADYQFAELEDGGRKVVFDVKKKTMDITLYIKANDGYIIDTAIMQAVTTNYLNNDKNYQSYVIDKSKFVSENKIVIKEVDQDIVFIIERVRRANMFIYFDAVGGEYKDSNPLYVFGEMGSTGSVSAPTNPTKENHKFDGWYTGEMVDEEVVYREKYDFDNITLVPDITLYAKWIEKSTLTFNSNDGTEIPSQELYNEVPLKPADPIKEHHKFDGWYTTETFDEGTEFDFTQPVTENTTIYAKWIEGKDFTFYLNDGSVGEDQTPTVYHTDTVYDTVVDKPTDPTREGYRFAGWYLEESCENAFDFGTIVSDNTSLYAKWVEQVTINFVTKVLNEKIADQIIDINTSIHYVKGGDLLQNGMALSFDGWALTEDVVEGEIILNESNIHEHVFTENTTLYARYEAIKGYVVFFDNVIEGMEIMFPVDTQGPDIVYQEDGSYAYVPLAYTTDLPIRVRLSDNLETDNMYLLVTNYNNDQEYETITGVKIESNVPTFEFKITITEVVRLRISATIVEKHIISFYKNEGITLPEGETEQVYATKIAYHDDVLPEYPTDPSRGVEYKFDGWYKEKECITKYDISEKVTSDFALYAKWIEGKKVTFYLNDGSETQKEWKSVYTYGEAVVEPTDKPIREGYRFDKWCIDEELTGIYDFSHIVEKNMSLYASWIETVTISFVTNKQGEQIANKVADKGKGIDFVVAGNYINETDENDRYQYIFAGWSLSRESETLIDFDRMVFGEDTTLYAVYTKKYGFTFYVPYDVDGTLIYTVRYYFNGSWDNFAYNDPDKVCSVFGRDAYQLPIKVRVTPQNAGKIELLTMIVTDQETGKELQRIDGIKDGSDDRDYNFTLSFAQNIKITLVAKRGI